MDFTPNVVAFETNKLFVWKGKVLIPGLFDGEHRFEIVDNGDGTTTFKQSENFNGILIPFFKEMIHVNTKQGFESMNTELKTRVEAM
ncbi:MAG: SRPBCC domain-containing protein [Bacteroidetes bacterium]|nr:SRPBCC domain-containing protein [Bacteroidota bacterium]NCQ11505.1 SRPBCC domain-containing protein [Bacteroidota bacterium]